MELKQQSSAQVVFGSAEPLKLFKAKVQVCGRFLLRPEEEFTPEKAEELAKRTVKDGTKVRTRLKLFSSGLRLGQNGIFASMPLEHIKYQRIAAACASPGSRLLAICTKDYEQKSVTVLKFKSLEALAEASSIIEKQRRMVAEEANYLFDTPNGREQKHTSNWALQTAATSMPGASIAAGSANHHEARVTVTRTTTAAPAAARATSSTTIEDDVFSNELSKRSASASAVVRNGVSPQIDSVILNYDDMNGGGATYAVFESNHGPPTRLNERVVAQPSTTAALRIQTTPPAMDQVDNAFTRPTLAYVSTTSTGSSAQRNGSLMQRQLPSQQLVQLQPTQQLVQLQPTQQLVQLQPTQQLVQFQPQNQQMQLVQLVPVRSRKHISLSSYRQPPHHHQQHQQFAVYPASRASMSKEYYYLMK